MNLLLFMILTLAGEVRKPGDVAASSMTNAVVASKASLEVEVVVDTNLVGDVRQEMVKWCQLVREACELNYPKLVDTLRDDGGTNLPRKLKITFAPGKDGVPAYRTVDGIFVNCKWVHQHPDDVGCVIHELSHVVQSYPNYDPWWLVEGIADYARFWVFEQVEKRPRIHDPARQKYTDGYQTTAAFLAWVEEQYPGTVKRLSMSLSRNKYKPGLVRDLTGKTYDELWRSFVTAKISDKAE